MPVPVRIPWLLVWTAAVIALAAFFVRPATADQQVSVLLLDAPPAGFAVSADPAAANPGTVTFNVSNVGAPYSYLPHNLVVIDTDLPPNQLPLTLDGQFVDEGQLDVIGQTPQFNPGETETLQVSLAPGNYVLICNNFAGHYAAGMYTPFQVTAPTPTISPTPKPTATPKNPAEDTDGDTLTNDIDPNDDNDGCTDVQELGDDPVLGGLRNPHNYWDFFDVPAGPTLERDGSIAAPDIFAVLGRFNATDAGPGDFYRNDSPESTPNPLTQDDRANYHPAYDRGPLVGWQPWDLGPPDGAVAAPDIFAVLAQFGHSCA